jgi:hypothetical protein
MRHLILLLGLLLASAAAQSAPSLSLEPTSTGVPYLLDSSNQVLKPLVEESWKIGHNSVFKAAYAGGTIAVNYEVSGGHSSFRIANDMPVFVFKFESPENAVLYLSSTKNDKDTNRRQFVCNRVYKNNKMELDPGIPIDITQFGESSYKLIPKAPLSPGEYAVMLRGSTQVKDHKIFTFGIDQ